MPNLDGLPTQLTYVSDMTPGIRRRRHGKGFSYRHDDPAERTALLSAIEPHGDATLRAEERHMLGFLIKPPDRAPVLES